MRLYYVWFFDQWVGFHSVSFVIIEVILLIFRIWLFIQCYNVLGNYLLFLFLFSFIGYV